MALAPMVSRVRFFTQSIEARAEGSGKVCGGREASEGS
jgi:hypothetical protein